MPPLGALPPTGQALVPPLGFLPDRTGVSAAPRLAPPRPDRRYCHPSAPSHDRTGRSAAGTPDRTGRSAAPCPDQPAVLPGPALGPPDESGTNACPVTRTHDRSGTNACPVTRTPRPERH
ncbi:hypothetical protein GCM10023341_12950 [Ornithinimicrobium tianjinense]